MKKLFFPIALLSVCCAYAENKDASGVELTQEQQIMQELVLQLAKGVYEDISKMPNVRDEWNNFSDEEKNELQMACIKFAELRYTVAGQYAPHFASIFEKFTELTGNDSWITQIPFVSEGYVAELQAAENAKNQGSEDEDGDDEN